MWNIVLVASEGVLCPSPFLTLFSHFPCVCLSPQILDVRNVMVVVSRWYGGILLGPDRFKHINNCARNILVEEGYTASTVRHSYNISLSSSTDMSSVKFDFSVRFSNAGKHLISCILIDCYPDMYPIISKQINDLSFLTTKADSESQKRTDCQIVNRYRLQFNIH